MSGTRTELACLRSALADLPIVQPITERVDMITTDRLTAWAKAHLESLSPERRAELDKDWI